MKKRFATFLLALCIAALPAFPAFAAEGGELTGESAQQINTETAYAERVPTSVAQARLAGGTDYLDKFGVTRAKVIAELSAHEHDSYYLNTPFVGGDWQSPRGDTSYNGAPGTNCAGFVGYVLRKCGLDVKAALATMKLSPRFTNWGSGLAYDGLASASNYFHLAEMGKVVAYAYPNKAALLAGGKLEKGDLVLRFWTDSWGGYDEDNHLMIFWGDTPSEDKVWQNASGRIHIGQMWTGDASSYIAIKFAPSKPPAPPVAGFQDVREDQWYAKEVAWVKETGLMGGTEADKFSPAKPVTRGQLVAVLWRLSEGPQVPSASRFTDVDPGEYYAPAVDWAAYLGIVNGRTEEKFAPNHAVTRQELATVLYRYCRIRGYVYGEGGPLDAYEDADELDPYAVEPMRWAVEKKLIQGSSATMLQPQAYTQRCQFAVILSRLYQLFGNET